jgi:hypothetical protein
LFSKIDDEKIIFLDLLQKGERGLFNLLLVYRVNKALGKGVEIKFGFKRGGKKYKLSEKKNGGKMEGYLQSRRERNSKSKLNTKKRRILNTH